MSCARGVIPFESTGKISINTIFRMSIVIIRISRTPISPGNFLVTTDILPIVVTVRISDSQPENMRCSDCPSGLFDYCVIQVLNPRLKKYASAMISKTIFTIFRCFSEIISSGFNVVTVAQYISVIIAQCLTR